jgi:tripartite ATP-independent transporter DctM subunit
MSLDLMPPLMFGGLVIFLLVGFPVAFSLCAVGLFFGFLSIELGFFTTAYLGNLPLRVFGILSNDLLLSIPFFTLMGAILERCGLAEDLLEGTGQLFGKVPGGLAYAVIIVGAILGAITGTVAASVIAMGMISLPIMIKYGYDMRIATGVIAASGTITQLIPPSLVLIVLGDQLGKSVGDMYAGAIGPSLLQIALFILFIAGVSIFAPHKVPPIPDEELHARGWPLYWRVIKGMVPSIVLIFLVLGTIFMGLATPTEAGAMGAVGAVVLAVINRRFTWTLLRQAMENTMRITAMVIFILVGATVFSLVFQGVDGSLWIEHLLSACRAGRRASSSSSTSSCSSWPSSSTSSRSPSSSCRCWRPSRQARHRPDLVRRAALHQPADELHAPALRLRAVLPARHRAQGGADARHLPGRHSLARPAAHPRRGGDLLADQRDLLPRSRHRRGPFHRQDRGAAARHARDDAAARLQVIPTKPLRRSPRNRCAVSRGPRLGGHPVQVHGLPRRSRGRISEGCGLWPHNMSSGRFLAGGWEGGVQGGVVLGGSG